MVKTYRKKFNKNVTRKNKSSSSSLQKFEQQIVVEFLVLLNTIKLYHWKTHSYATHKATDELYGKLNDNVDSFVEVLLGKSGDRINLTNVRSIPLKDFTSIDQLKKEINNFKGYLVSLNNNNALKTMSNSDLFKFEDNVIGKSMNVRHIIKI